MNPARVFLSYSHDSENHRRNIADLAQELRSKGLDAQIDQYAESKPPLSWPHWMSEQLREADFVLLVFTETYARRFEGRERPGVGLGARWEGAIVTSDLYHEESDTVKYIPVVVAADDSRLIPAPLRLTTFYVIGSVGNRDLDRLFRHLHDVPAIVPAPIGPPPELESQQASGRVPGDSEVHRALALAGSGNQDEAEEILSALVDSPDRASAANAAYQLGLIRLNDEQYAASIVAFQRAVELSTSRELTESIVNQLSQALEVMNAHYGEGSAVEAARDYLTEIQAGRFDQVWIQTEQTLRLVLAQAWVWNNRNHPNLRARDINALVSSLSSLTSDDPVKVDFWATQQREMQDAFQAFNPETWGAAERPRRFGIDYELVIFMETGGEVLVFNGGMSPPTIPLLLRRVGPTWQMANFRPEYPVPGMPPSSRPLPNLDLNIVDVGE